MPLDRADLNFLELWSQLEVQYRQGAQGVHAEVVCTRYVACQGVVSLELMVRGGLKLYLVPVPNKTKTPPLRFRSLR